MSLEFPPQHSNYSPHERGLVGGEFRDAPVFVARGGNRTATVALVLGIVSFVLAWVPIAVVFVLGVLTGIAAIVVGAFGLAAWVRLRAGRARAITGIILGGGSLLVFFATAASLDTWFLA